MNCQFLIDRFIDWLIDWLIDWMKWWNDWYDTFFSLLFDDLGDDEDREDDGEEEEYDSMELTSSNEIKWERHFSIICESMRIPFSDNLDFLFFWIP